VVRSFTDRLLGGVCGGIGASLRLNAWIVRLAFAVGTLVTLGAVAVWYVALWLALPQGSLVIRRGGLGTTLTVLILGVVIVGVWAADRAGVLPLPTGQSIYIPAMIALFGLILMARQVRL
jgi:phage shock protein PspC (stress-responsive transcriptional regulator)